MVESKAVIQNEAGIHCRPSAILVKEGDSVKTGQILARIGGNRDSQILHFEIRRDGKPEDPLRYLPKRGG